MIFNLKKKHQNWCFAILPDDDDDSLLLDDSALLESLDSLLSLLDELDECRFRLFDFFFLPFFELLLSLRLSAFVLPLIADEASPRFGSVAVLIFNAKISIAKEQLINDKNKCAFDEKKKIKKNN